MNQPHATKTTPTTQKRTLAARIEATLRRRWLTVEEAVALGLSHDLRKRVSEFKRNGCNVVDKWITLPSGTKIKAWRILK
jgi:hypothetical protein